MLRPTRFSLLRTPIPSQVTRLPQRHQRRFIFSTPPSQKPRSFKGGLARWALAGGALYWYTTRDHDIFAPDARSRLASQQNQIIIETHDENEELPTVDSIRAARRERQAATMAQAPISPAAEPSVASGESNAELAEKASAPTPAGASASSELASSEASSSSSAAAVGAAASASPAGLEEEAESEGAFNEETGEINWDCPCLGGMAHGPCGEQFREAFSCFVFSKEEPKGIDCIERFKTMQDCFREHPDVYGAELTDEPEDDEDAVSGPSDTTHMQQESATEPSPPSTGSSSKPNSATADEKAAPSNPPKPSKDSTQKDKSETKKTKAPPTETQNSASPSAGGEGEELTPKAYHDARDEK